MTTKPTLFAAAGALGLALLSGCDDKTTNAPGSRADAAAPVATAAESVAPAPPTRPQLAVDDTAVFVSGERLDAAAPDLKGRIIAALGDRPVAGETLVLNAARDAKMPKIAAVFAALVAKKAKAVEVHTPLRDKSASEIVFTTSTKPSDCSAVGFIARDSAITAWPASGATAERFARGMAGPDITRGSEGVRKRVLACDSPVFFLSSDDAVTWGLTYDLARAVLFPEDAGLPKARSAAVLVRTPVPGRKVEVDVVD
ncbi:MAG: hypothetical protein JWP97_1240 [Labilithrix sp.]|nr:hypothetical protein [Labilithrix sp.]